MRISDWSSDVCSSDLDGFVFGAHGIGQSVCVHLSVEHRCDDRNLHPLFSATDTRQKPLGRRLLDGADVGGLDIGLIYQLQPFHWSGYSTARDRTYCVGRIVGLVGPIPAPGTSEDPPSELPSLMPTSSALLPLT